MNRKKGVIALLVVMVVVLGGSLIAYGHLMQETDLADEALAHIYSAEGIEVPEGAELRRYFDEDHGHYHYYLYFPSAGHGHNHDQHHDHGHNHAHLHSDDIPEGAELRRYFDEDHGHYHYYLYFPDGGHHEHHHDHHTYLPAPDFEILNIQDGSSVHLSDFLGQPIVLNFWMEDTSQTLSPSTQGLHVLNEVYNQYGDYVKFIALHVSDTTRPSNSQQLVEQYVNAQDINVPIFYDSQATAIHLYGITSVPQTFFINPTGNIVSFAVGLIDEDALRQGISIAQ